jgi:hypothetical protein
VPIVPHEPPTGLAKLVKDVVFLQQPPDNLLSTSRSMVLAPVIMNFLTSRSLTMSIEAPSLRVPSGVHRLNFVGPLASIRNHTGAYVIARVAGSQELR